MNDFMLGTGLGVEEIPVNVSYKFCFIAFSCFVLLASLGGGILLERSVVEFFGLQI